MPQLHPGIQPQESGELISGQSEQLLAAGADFIKKPYSTLVLKIHAKKNRETRKLESVNEKHFVEWKTRTENQTKTRACRRLELMLRNLD